VAARCRAQREWTRRFHPGADPGAPARDAAGRCAAKVGKLEALEYDARTGRVHSIQYERHNGRRWESRKHVFDAESAPTVVRTRGGKAQLTGGSYAVSSQRGFKDMAKKKGKRRAKKNVFRASSGDKMMTFVERVATVGVTAVGANTLSKVLVDKYTDWAPRTKAIVRAVAQIGLGAYISPDYPRIAAGLATGGAVIAGEELAASAQIETRIADVLPARTSSSSSTTTPSTTTSGARGLPAGGAGLRVTDRVRERTAV
jgi:hypothetical protein